MSIVSEIERIKTNIANAYTKCEEKGATMPSVLNSANLFDCIASITGGAVPAKVLSYYGILTGLSSASRYLAGTSIDGKALFGGGTSGASSSSTGLKTVNVYDENLTKTTATSLTNGVRLLGATSNKNYAMFGGGQTQSGASYVKDAVDAYDKDLVKTTTNLSVGRCFYNDTNTNVGEYALFSTGSGADGYCNNIDAYNGDLVLTTIVLDTVKIHGGGTSIGNKALFAGGAVSGGAYTTEIDVYNENLVKLTSAELSTGLTGIFSVSNNSYAIFAGGGTASDTTVNTVEAFDVNLVKTTATSLKEKKYRGATAKLGEYAMIAGGATKVSTGNESDLVEVFNDKLVKTIEGKLQYKTRYNAGATAGDKYAVFAGGQWTSSDTAINSADAFELVG